MRFVSKYWLFQLLGWTLFFLFSTYIALLVEEFDFSLLAMNLGLSLFGIALTHLYRKIILSQHWHLLELEKLLPKVILGIFVLSICYGIFYYALFYFIYPNLFQLLTIKKALGSFVSIFTLFVLWNTFYFLWSYIETSRKNIIEKLKMESDLKDMEIKTLRSNLQPHFIFNALNSIRALIDENPEKAREAITQISNILRNSISKQQATDTLENELSLIEDYLALEKIRFEDRLQCSKSIAAESLQVQVPTMMLQTLVENAIKHGISRREDGGEIKIISKIVGQHLQLEVINTGEIDTETMHPESLGFGVHATNRRLQYIYGNEASLTLSSESEFVRATIILPIKSKQHD